MNKENKYIFFFVIVHKWVQFLKDKLFEFDEHIVVIVLIKTIPKSSRSYIVPCQIEFMLKSTQNLLHSTGILKYDRPKKCPTILFAVNLWLKPVSLGLVIIPGLNAHCFVIKCGPLKIWIYCRYIADIAINAIHITYYEKNKRRTNRV